MKITIEKQKNPMLASRPWRVKVDGQYLDERGYKTKKAATEVVEAATDKPVSKTN